MPLVNCKECGKEVSKKASQCPYCGHPLKTCTFKNAIERIQTIITIIAIIVGGIWTYSLFIKERKHYPHADIEQKVSHIALSNRINLLRVEIGLTNKGNSRLVTKKSIIRIQQILPIIKISPINQVNTALKETVRKDDRFMWPLLSERIRIFEMPLDIEPGEKEVIDFEFMVPSKVEVIRVYSYFRNEEKKKDEDEVGWAISTYYDLKKAIKGRDK